ncbi:MAG: UbiA prenyltransferase family protein [Candidatus Limnocylindrales bacterium]
MRRGARAARRGLRLGRLIHPFPSLLNAGATAVFALLAGGAAADALGLAGAMFALQASIGAANDVVDAPADAQAKPAKPIPAGLVSRRTATAVAVMAGAVGLTMAGVFGVAALAVAVLGYGLGLAYDVRLKRSPWSWLAYALALPLVPAFAWLGVGAGLPPRFPLLAVMALLGGVALALANGLVDLAGDARTGTSGPAGALGAVAAWRLIAACQGALIAVAVVTSLWLGAPLAATTWLALGGATIAIAIGVVLSGREQLRRRQLGWELQAAGVGLLAAGWFAAQLGAG